MYALKKFFGRKEKLGMADKPIPNIRVDEMAGFEPARSRHA